jgi:hypothetical protein
MAPRPQIADTATIDRFAAKANLLQALGNNRHAAGIFGSEGGASDELFG